MRVKTHRLLEIKAKKIKIDRIKPDSAASDQTIAIVGSSFGQVGKVLIADQPANVISWEDNLILVSVPAGIPIGKATIVVEHGETTKLFIRVLSTLKRLNMTKAPSKS